MVGRRRAEGQMQQADQEQRLEAVESQQMAAPAPAPAPAASAGISSETVQKLQELGKLHDQGVLTDDEFTTQKERLLAI
jgi:hypothetical protein